MNKILDYLNSMQYLKELTFKFNLYFEKKNKNFIKNFYFLNN